MPRLIITGVPILSSGGDGTGAVYKAHGKQQVTQIMGRGKRRGVYQLYAYSWFPDNVDAYVEGLEKEGYVVEVAEFSQIMEKDRDLANDGIWVRIDDAPPKVSALGRFRKAVRRSKTKGQPKTYPSIAGFRKEGR